MNQDNAMTRTEIIEMIESVDADCFDIEAAMIDIDNGNFESIMDYDWTDIIKNSIINGQYTQAKDQCRRVGIDYDSCWRRESNGQKVFNF